MDGWHGFWDQNVDLVGPSGKHSQASKLVVLSDGWHVPLKVLCIPKARPGGRLVAFWACLRSIRSSGDIVPMFVVPSKGFGEAWTASRLQQQAMFNQLWATLAYSGLFLHKALKSEPTKNGFGSHWLFWVTWLSRGLL